MDNQLANAEYLRSFKWDEVGRSGIGFVAPSKYDPRFSVGVGTKEGETDIYAVAKFNPNHGPGSYDVYDVTLHQGDATYVQPGALTLEQTWKVFVMKCAPSFPVSPPIVFNRPFINYLGMAAFNGSLDLLAQNALRLGLGLSVGDSAYVLDGNDSAKAVKVTRTGFSHFNNVPYFKLYGVARKKDGTWSQREIVIAAVALDNEAISQCNFNANMTTAKAVLRLAEDRFMANAVFA